MSGLRSHVRVGQTVDEVDRLRKEFDDWKKRRDEADTRKRYVTQLQALKCVVSRALLDVRTDTLAILDDPDVGSVYQRSALQDKRLLWIRRVLWGFYREKFDQRDGTTALQQVLEAADDVVWSCYRGAFEQFGAAKAPGPIPLAYIEPFYSPQALPRNEVPGVLKEKRLGDRFLADFFTKLPIPLVSLPPRCVAAPWWLIYLGHEVGHHIQHDLDLVDPFGDLLKNAVAAGDTAAQTSPAALRWADWGQEIFADAFSVYMMGAPAVVAMIELETHPAPDMLVSKDDYPSPGVRLTLLAQIARALNLTAEPPVAWLEDASKNPDVKDLEQEARADLRMLDRITPAVTAEKIGSLATLRTVTGWNDADFAPAGIAARWERALIEDKGYPNQRQLTQARVIVSSSVAVWQKVAAIGDDAKRATALGVLGGRVLEWIRLTRDEATRAGERTAAGEVGAVAADISERLRHVETFDW